MGTNEHDREFWARVGPETSWLHRQLRRLGVRASDAEDLTQDVLVAVYQKWREYDRARPLRAWLFGFAFREASEYRRRPARQRETLDADGRSDREPDEAPLPDEGAAAAQKRRLVLEALQSIELERRAVFVMVEIEELAVTEVADALGVPLNTAYSRLRLARGEFVEAVKRITLRAKGATP